MFKVGIGSHGRKPPKHPSDFNGRVDALGVMCGLEDLYTTTAVKDYLFMNGKYDLVPVSSNWQQENYFCSKLCLHHYFSENLICIFSISGWWCIW